MVKETQLTAMEMDMKEKQFHKGYTSDIFLLESLNGKLLKKYFRDKSSPLSKGMSMAEVFNKEIEGIQLLNSIHVDNILTPKVHDIDYKDLWYSQSYYTLESFYRHVVIHSWCKPVKLQSLFYSLGRYLAIFHNTYQRLHGDLNRKNILFCMNKVFICDPSFDDKYINEKYTYDLFRVITNFYPYNLFYRPLIRGKKALISAFLKGYYDNSDKDFDKEKFKSDTIRYLNLINVHTLKGLVSYLRYLYIRYLNKRMALSLGNNKMDCDYEV
jgi:tRNA A-37 threonylcarbamoyl transferase component Bud32